jgi:hypothetical protein
MMISIVLVFGGDVNWVVILSLEALSPIKPPPPSHPISPWLSDPQKITVP